nr:zinc ion binding protein [Tanacetum cinerariifolium]
MLLHPTLSQSPSHPKQPISISSSSQSFSKYGFQISPLKKPNFNNFVIKNSSFSKVHSYGTVDYEKKPGTSVTWKAIYKRISLMGDPEKDMRTRANLSKALGQIVKDISKGCGSVESFVSLMEDVVECEDFMDYFKAIWYPRLGERVKVVDQVDRDLYHEIWNPGSEYAICSCEWGENGNLCEHVCKVIQYHREKGSILPSISLLQYSQCLINMLKWLPANSLIRDDAVSLAVWVNEQLSAQFAKSAQNGVSSVRAEMVNSYTLIEIDLE